MKLRKRKYSVKDQLAGKQLNISDDLDIFWEII